MHEREMCACVWVNAFDAEHSFSGNLSSFSFSVITAHLARSP